LVFNEKLFISWVGPRGIVAAGIASLFSLKLMQKGIQEAEILTPLVFAIVLGTVVLNATTARLMASILKVKQAVSDGIMIVGANTATRIIASYLKEQNKHVVLVDNSEEMVDKARDIGLEAIQANVYNMDLEENFDLLDMGYLMSMTSNDSVNEYVCKHYQEVFGENGTYRLISKEEMEQKMVKNEHQTLFATFSDFYHVNEIAKNNANAHEIQIKSITHFEQLIKELKKRKFIPLFIKHQDGRITIISAQHMTLSYETNDKLVYLGEPIQFKENKPSRLEEQFLSAIVE
jgi:NhaP-type Na+/H+ or K+/H+ antiporter